MSNKPEFTSQETGLAIALVAGLDPDRFGHPEAKALIYKAKSAKAAGAFTVP